MSFTVSAASSDETGTTRGVSRAKSAAAASQLARCPLEHGEHDFVEPPQTAKARLLRNLGHRPDARVEQRAREVSAARPGDEQRRRAEVFGK